MPAPILLPPSFQNSFWSQDDFRTGMEVLFGKLEQVRSAEGSGSTVCLCGRADQGMMLSKLSGMSRESGGHHVHQGQQERAEIWLANKCR